MLYLGWALLVSALAAAAAQPADLIVHSGRIVTVDPRFRVAESMAILGDRVAAVGSNAEVRKHAGSKTRQIDLQGKTVLPGLMDSHVHAVGAALFEFHGAVPEMETIADVLKYVEARARTAGEGEWIWVRQVFITRLREQRFPTRAELDRAAPRNPVVFATGPDASLNSLALKLSGIDKEFRIADGKPGRIERDPQTGEPTGILRSGARFIKSPPAQAPSRQAQRERLKALLADYNSAGITSIADRDAAPEEVELYRLLKQAGELSCRVFLNLSIDGQAPIEDIEARIAEAAAGPLHSKDEMLWLRGIKVYLDGGMLTGSAYMLRPWGVSKVYSIDDPTYRGLRFIEPAKLYRIFRAAMKNDLQPTAHAVGDGAVTAMVDAYEEISNELPVRDHRPCISHSNFMTAEAIARMKKLGVVADLQPAWLWLDGATLLKQFGSDRLAYFQPYRSLFEAGVTVGGGSDHMQKIGSLRSINPYNPFLGMWITLTRRPRWMDGPLRAEQSIAREQAIRLYTVNNAYLMFAERDRGSLEAGKLADFIVIDRDILRCPVDEVKDIKVEQTYLGGRLVYQRSR